MSAKIATCAACNAPIAVGTDQVWVHITSAGRACDDPRPMEPMPPATYPRPPIEYATDGAPLVAVPREMLAVLVHAIRPRTKGSRGNAVTFCDGCGRESWPMDRGSPHNDRCAFVDGCELLGITEAVGL